MKNQLPERLRARNAMEILDRFTSEDDQPLQDVKILLHAFCDKIEAIHEPLTGEAYPEDRNRYCAVCMSLDGGSARHPCLTVKRVRELLRRHKQS